MQDWQKYLLALAAVVAIFAVPFIVNPTAEFGGADNAGVAGLLEKDPAYQRWARPLWQPPPETESMLFALQAAIGALIVGYFIGHEKARREFGKEENGGGPKTAPHEKK